MPRDKMGIKGAVKWVVREHTQGGLQALSELKYRLESGKLKLPEYEDLRRNILHDPRYSHVKKRKQSWVDKILKRHPIMQGENHNIVTNEGDALIADILQVTPERTKLDGTAIIGVGTGFVSETKTVDALVTQTGSDETLDSGYPQTKGDWAAADDGIIVYVATFDVGDLNDTGIDEAILQSTTPDTMAYAQISPTVDVASTDTLEITWEITLLGS